jgi:predicted dehydrogenase
MANTISWGIIGCGNVTEVKSGPAFQKVSNSKLVAVMRRDASKAADYALRHGVPKWYSDATQLINDPAVTAIYIATPPAFHEAYTIEALQAGKPVYVEKPMSIDLASCLRMQQMAETTGIPLCIAHYRRALPKFIAVQQLLASQTIGTVCTARIGMQQADQSATMANPENNWRVQPALSGGGIFYDLAPHQLDLLVFLLGNPEEIKGMADNRAGLYAAEDVVAGIVRMQNQVLFSGLWCFTSDNSCREDIFEIVGTAGKIIFPVFGNEVTVITSSGEQHLNFEPPKHIQQPMIEKVTRYFLGMDSNPCSAEEAIQSFRIMEAFVYGRNKAL